MEKVLESCLHTFEKSCVSGTVTLTLDGKLIFVRQFNQYIKVNINYSACADARSDGTKSEGSGIEKSRHGVHGKRSGREESSCCTQGKMSVYETSSTQNKGSGIEGPVETFLELATREFRDNNLVCRAQGNKLSTNPNGANQTNSLLTGAELTNSLSTGANQTKSVPTGAMQTIILPTGENQTDSLSKRENPSSSSLKRENQINSSLKGAYQINSSLKGANQINSSLKGANQINSSLKGANQINSSPKGANQINSSLKGANQINSSLRGANQINSSLKGANQINSSPKGANQINSSLKGANQINSSPKGANQINSYPIGTDQSSNNSQAANQINDYPIGTKLSSSNPNGENQSTSYPKEVNQSSSYFTESNHYSNYLKEASDSSYSKEETQLIIALCELVQSSSCTKEEIELTDYLKKEIQDSDQSSSYIKEETQLSHCQNESDRLNSCLKEEIKLSNFLNEFDQLNSYLKEETESSNGLEEENQVSICNMEKKLSRTSATRQLCCKAKYQSEVSSHEPELKKCKKSGEIDNVASCEKYGVSDNDASCMENDKTDNVASCMRNGVSDNESLFVHQNAATVVMKTGKVGKLYGQNVASASKTLGTSDVSLTPRTDVVADDSCVVVGYSAPPKKMSSLLGLRSHLSHKPAVPMTVINRNSVDNNTFQPYIHKVSKNANQTMIAQKKALNFYITSSANSGISQNNFQMPSSFSCNQAGGINVMCINPSGNTLQAPKFQESKYIIKTFPLQGRPLNTFVLHNSLKSDKHQHRKSIFSPNQVGLVTTLCKQKKHIIKTIPVQDRSLNKLSLQSSEKSDQNEGKEMDNISKGQESNLLCPGLQNNEDSQKSQTIQKKLSPFPDATAKLDSSSVVDSGFEIIEVVDSSEEGEDGGKDEICCPYCLDVFRNQQEYLNHKQIKRLSFDCKVCGETFPFKAHHRVHMRSHDTTMTGDESETSFKCELCNKNFLNIPLLKGHMMIHTGEYAYQCCLCQKKSRSMAMHDKHMKAHDRSVKQKCLCCDSFFTAAEYKIHVNAHSKCHFCDQVFHNRMSRNFHYQKYHQDKCVNCEHCGNTFSSSKYLAAHLNDHCEKGREHCELCGILVFNLDVHMKQCHHGPGNKNLLCRHVLEHSNKMMLSNRVMYSCRKCQTIFSKAGGLLTHLTKKHKIYRWIPRTFIQSMKSI